MANVCGIFWAIILFLAVGFYGVATVVQYFENEKCWETVQTAKKIWDRDQDRKNGKKQKDAGEVWKNVVNFAIMESPEELEKYQRMRSKRKSREVSIEELRKMLVEFGRDPEEDVEFAKINKESARLDADIASVSNRLVAAYIKARMRSLLEE